MKVVPHLLFFLFTITVIAQKETIPIPKGVVYNYASNEVIEKARQLITDNLSDSPDYTILQKTIIIGPQLWKRYKDNPKIQQIKEGKIQFHVDDMVLAGKMSQDLTDAQIIWDEFRKEVANDFTIRKANTWELKYYWSVISFYIDEPLLIVATKEHNYILNLLKDDLKLMWLDEAPAQTYVTYRNGEEVDTLSKGIKETKIEKVVLLNTDEELKNNSSVEDISLIIAKTNAIFDELFKNSDKSGKIMITFELKKKKNTIQFAVRDDIDLELMKEFEKRINAEKYPLSKKDPIKIQLIYKVNSFDDTE